MQQMLKFKAKKKKILPFPWRFGIKNISLQSIYDFQEVVEPQQAGTRIHSCIPATGHIQNTRLN